MSLIIILLAVFNNFAIRRPYLLSAAPHIIARPPPKKNRKRGYAPGHSGSHVVWTKLVIAALTDVYGTIEHISWTAWIPL